MTKITFTANPQYQSVYQIKNVLNMMLFNPIEGPVSGLCSYRFPNIDTIEYANLNAFYIQCIDSNADSNDLLDIRLRILSYSPYVSDSAGWYSITEAGIDLLHNPNNKTIVIPDVPIEDRTPAKLESKLEDTISSASYPTSLDLSGTSIMSSGPSTIDLEARIQSLEERIITLESR